MGIDPVVFVALGAIVCYPFYRWALTALMQPVRLAFADEGVQLLNSPHLPEAEKALVDRYLDDAFDWKFAPFTAITMLPILGWMVFKAATGRDSSIPIELEQFSSRPEAEKFIQLHVLCVAGSNPLFAAIVVFELLLVLLPALLVLRSLSAVSAFVETRIIGWLATRNHAH